MPKPNACTLKKYHCIGVSGSANDADILVAEIDITEDDISQLNTNPKELLPSLGPGYVYSIQQYIAFFEAGSIQYTFPGSTNAFISMGGQNLYNLGNPFTSATDRIITAGGQFSVLIPDNNVVLNISNNPIDGNGTMRIRLFYTIETI